MLVHGVVTERWRKTRVENEKVYRVLNDISVMCEVPVGQDSEGAGGSSAAEVKTWCDEKGTGYSTERLPSRG